MGIFLVSKPWVTSLRALRCKKEVPVSFIRWVSTLDVLGEVWLLRGSVDTLRAGVGLLPGVRAEMAAQVTPVHESSPAERTHQSRHRADRQPTTAITDCRTQTLLWEERANVTLSPPTASAANTPAPTVLPPAPQSHPVKKTNKGGNTPWLLLSKTILLPKICVVTSIHKTDN